MRCTGRVRPDPLLQTLIGHLLLLWGFEGLDRVSTEQLFDEMCHNFGGLWPKFFANGQTEMQELRRSISSKL
jgi:hypothetical protein